MRSVSELNNNEIINYLNEINNKDNKSLDDINLLLMLTNYLELRLSREKEDLRKSSIDIDTKLLEEDVERLEKHKFISKRSYDFGHEYLKSKLASRVWHVVRVNSYKDNVILSDVGLDYGIYVKYDVNRPYHFYELLTGREIPISFDTMSHQISNSNISTNKLMSKLKIKKNNICSVGSDYPDALSISYVLIIDMFDLRYASSMKSKANYDLGEYLKKDPNYVDTILDNLYRKGLEDKYRELYEKSLIKYSPKSKILK